MDAPFIVNKSFKATVFCFLILFLSTSVNSFSQVNLSWQLLAYYPFTGNANDSSGNGNNPIFNNTTLTADRFGNPNSACYFNGTTSYIEIPNSTSLNPTGNQITLCAWVKPTGFNSTGCKLNFLFSKEVNSSLPSYGLEFSSQGYSNGSQCSLPVDTVHQDFYGPTNYADNNSYQPYIQENNWYFVVYTYDGTNTRVYVNNVLSLTTTESISSFANSADLFLGKINNTNSEPFWLNGVLDDVRIYGRAITTQEIDSLYKPNTNPTPTNNCNTYLDVTAVHSGVHIGDLSITGNQLTVEAIFNQTLTNDPTLGGGDIVSKHQDPSDDNYLLRPNDVSIATDNGFFEITTACKAALNVTHHAAMVYDGTTLKFYRDGYLVGQTPASGNLITNSYNTTIGSPAGTGDYIFPEDFLGYINEVRIWNVARPQDSIRAYMATPLPSPKTQNGLLAYYDFDSLINLQGNTAWNGSLFGGAAINQTNPTCASFTPDSCGIIIPPDSTPTINFSAPDTVCLNTPVTITNLSTYETTNYWNFCTANLNTTTPIGTNLGNLGGSFSMPTFMDYVQQDSNYYGFVSNYSPSGIVRLDFGNSLLNIPNPVFLGNIGGVMDYVNGAEGIQVVKNEGHWYAFVVGGSTLSGGNSNVPKLLKFDFGTDITNTSPTATEFDNIGGVDQPIDFYMFQDSSNWYGFTVNSENNTITRFNFTNSFNNTPTAVNLGNVGNLLSYPTGIKVLQSNGNWHAFITNDSAGIENSPNSYIVRLDFGNSLLNTPTAVNLGNPNGVLRSPRDLYIYKQCSQTVGFAVNYDNTNDIVRFDLDDSLQNISNAVSLGNVGNFSFPHSINKIFRVGANLYSFVTNVNNNTLTRLEFVGCTNASIPNSTATNPPTITYNTPGTYNISLTTDEGLPTQNSYCKQIVVLPPADLDFSFVQDNCNPLLVTFQNKSNPLNPDTYSWNLGNGSIVSALNTVYSNYNSYGDYTVTLTNTSGCSDTISKTIPVQVKVDSLIITNDTTICYNTNVQLKSVAASSYCWKPGTGLSDSTIQNPIATPTTTTTYHLNSLVNSPNLVFNGDFTLGDTGFSSMYKDSTKGINVYTVGTYTVDTTATIWHPFFARCHDHTGNGKMLIVNGAPTLGKIAWQQTISNVQTNTNYLISSWLQSMSINNPARIQFIINGKAVGDTFTAISDTCIWQQALTTWNSGNNTSATIAIIDWDTIGSGNDFALDDIAFYNSTVNTDSITITVNSLSPSPTVDTVTCVGQSIQLVAAPANTYQWSSSPLYSVDNLQSVTVNPTSSSVFTVTRYNSFGCSVTDTFKVNLESTPLLDFSFVENICNPLSIQFKNESSDNFSYSWDFGNGVTSSDTNPSIVFSAYGTYNVSLKNTDGCAASVTKSITLSLVSDTVITTKDTVLCPGVQLQLGTIPALTYCWSPSTGLSDASVSNPTVIISTPQTYYVNAQLPTTNLVINGDFSQGNTGFSSQYTYNPNTGIPEGVYWVGPTPYTSPTNYWHPAFSPCLPVSGSGNMMMVNGASTPGTIVWAEDIQIQPNTNYAFSVWAESISPNSPAQLQFTINGKTIGNVFTALEPTCLWKQFFILWNSGDTASANISIINLNTEADGNDFAIDDISFAKFIIANDSIHINVSTAPTVSILNNDTAICQLDSFQLLATGAATYQWTPSNYLSNTAIANPIASPLQTTTYVVTGYNDLGCSDSAFLQVTVNSLPSIAITKDTGVCTGSSIGLLVSSPTANTYFWQSNPTLSATNVPNPIATPTDTTTYFATVTDINNCSSKDSVTVQLWPLPTVKTIADDSVCVQSVIILKTTDSLTTSFQWQPSTGLSDATVLSPTDTALSLGATKYLVSAFTNHGCLATDSVKITGLLVPSIILNADSLTLCIGKSETLKATTNVPSSYLWYPSNGLSNSAIANPVAMPDSTITYHVQVTGTDKCIATDSVYIYIKQKPAFAITPISASICNGDSVLITASGGNAYLWKEAVRNLDSSANYVNPTISTTYMVLVTDTICALGTPLSVDVTVNYPPLITLQKSNDIDCIVTTATLSAYGAEKYIWMNIYSTPISNFDTAIVAPYQNSRYLVKAFSSEGCITDTSITVNVEKADAGNGYDVPNAFTPTGHNNQCFGVKEWGHVINFQFDIYNRFGQKIYTTNNLDGCWDGTLNGTLQDAGTYIYEINASTICGEVHRKGAFVLIR